MNSGIIACAVITALLAIFVVILRFYARWCLVKKVRAEDWCILASMFMAVATSINLARRECFVPAVEKHPREPGKLTKRQRPIGRWESMLIPCQRNT